jgi:hypothetical protein
MSISVKYAMVDELQFNQYVYALHDSVDKRDGSLLIDRKDASKYANTITSDALDTGTILRCMSAKLQTGETRVTTVHSPTSLPWDAQ